MNPQVMFTLFALTTACSPAFQTQQAVSTAPPGAASATMTAQERREHTPWKVRFRVARQGQSQPILTGESHLEHGGAMAYDGRTESGTVQLELRPSELPDGRLRVKAVYEERPYEGPGNHVTWSPTTLLSHGKTSTMEATLTNGNAVTITLTALD